MRKKNNGPEKRVREPRDTAVLSGMFIPEVDAAIERFILRIPRYLRVPRYTASDVREVRELTPEGLTPEWSSSHPIAGTTHEEFARRSHRHLPTPRFWKDKVGRKTPLSDDGFRVVERWFRQMIASRRPKPLKLAFEIRKARKAAHELHRWFDLSLEIDQRIHDEWLDSKAWPKRCARETSALRGHWRALQESTLRLVEFDPRYLLRPFGRFGLTFAEALDSGGVFLKHLGRALGKRGQWSHLSKWNAERWVLCRRAHYIFRGLRRRRSDREIRRLMVDAMINYERLAGVPKPISREGAYKWLNENGW